MLRIAVSQPELLKAIITLEDNDLLEKVLLSALKNRKPKNQIKALAIVYGLLQLRNISKEHKGSRYKKR